MISTETLNRWLLSPPEGEQLEFKEAKQQFDTIKLLRYCVALANEGGGHLVLGVTDKVPRKIVGTHAFKNPNAIKARIVELLRIRVEITEVQHPAGRVLIFDIPSRPVGQPLHYEGAYLMRAGEDLVPMTPDQLKRIFEEGRPVFLEKIAETGLTAGETITLLDVQTFFDLLKLPFPSSHEGIIERLVSESLVRKKDGSFVITNLGALLLAKDLERFKSIYRKAPRIVVYKGKNKLETVRDQFISKGYIAGFETLISFITNQLPSNEVIGKALRTETRMYPEIAIRELVANALLHQDFDESGTSPMIEIYSDRLEISNPGKPLIPVERFVDEYKSRNEKMADLMRRVGICEEKSSGIDKVISSTELFQLPAPDFRVSEHHTTAILFAHKNFEDMDRGDRIRACYQHACLRYVSNEKMTNQSLRDRFQLPEAKSEAVSRIISEAIEEGFIKLDDPQNRSKRYTKYAPFWA